MKVLITGGFGYFGTALALRLSSEHEVFAVGRAPRSGAADRVRALLRDPRIHAAEADVHALPVGWARGTEAIVHLAGGGAPGGQSADAAADLLDNVGAAACVAERAPHGARLLLASSIYVYGTSPRPFRETDTLAPDTLYGQMKAVAEAVWRQRGGTALRFAHIYGAGAGIDFGRDGVTERLARAAAGGAAFAMHGDGAQWIDLCHIDDACEAMALALRAQELPPAVNIGGAPVTVTDLARVFQGIGDTGREGAICWNCCMRPREPGYGVCLRCANAGTVGRAPVVLGPSARVLDIALARSALGWTPRVSLAEGGRGLIEMVRSGGGVA